MSIKSLVNMINTTTPYAWDDSLTVYEFLGKIVSKINEVVELINLKIPDDFETSFYAAFREYTAEEMNRVIASGQFETILEGMISNFEPIKNEVIAARGTETSLLARLNKIAETIPENAQQNFYYGDTYPTAEQIALLNEGDVFFVVGEPVEQVLPFFYKNFDMADGPFTDSDFITYKDTTLNTTTHGLTYTYSNGRLSIKSTNSKNNGTNNSCEFGIRTAPSIVMPTGDEQLILEYEQSPETLIGGAVTCPSLSVIKTTEWNSGVTYTPYFTPGVLNAFTLITSPQLVESVKNTAYVKPNPQTITYGTESAYTLPTVAKMKIIFTASKVTVIKNGLTLFTLNHSLGGHAVYFCFGNSMYVNGEVVEVVFDNIKMTRK